jgi:hypothetical protein
MVNLARQEHPKAARFQIQAARCVRLARRRSTNQAEPVETQPVQRTGRILELMLDLIQKHFSTYPTSTSNVPVSSPPIDRGERYDAIGPERCNLGEGARRGPNGKGPFQLRGPGFFTRERPS